MILKNRHRTDIHGLDAPVKTYQLLFSGFVRPVFPCLSSVKFFLSSVKLGIDAFQRNWFVFFQIFRLPSFKN
jgi:hypothetical protein